MSNWTSYDATQRAFMEEMCILVNEQDTVLGPCSKKECHAGEGKLHRAFSVFLFNSKNELLLQQRSLDKITFPSNWANTCCRYKAMNIQIPIWKKLRNMW